MNQVPDHLQEMWNEIESAIRAHTPEGEIGKIDWTNFFAFLKMLIELLGPILIPLIVKPTIAKDQ